ncbi:MAG: hypothetical protein RIM33_10100 [Alphaproteobacteria bacterium]
METRSDHCLKLAQTIAITFSFFGAIIVSTLYYIGSLYVFSLLKPFGITPLEHSTDFNIIIIYGATIIKEIIYNIIKETKDLIYFSSLLIIVIAIFIVFIKELKVWMPHHVLRKSILFIPLLIIFPLFLSFFYFERITERFAQIQYKKMVCDLNRIVYFFPNGDVVSDFNESIMEANDQHLTVNGQFQQNIRELSSFNISKNFVRVYLFEISGFHYFAEYQTSSPPAICSENQTGLQPREHSIRRINSSAVLLQEITPWVGQH